jgi:hypothetical protein
LASKPDAEIDVSDIPALTDEQLSEMAPYAGCGIRSRRICPRGGQCRG